LGAVPLLLTFVAMVQDLKTGKIKNWLIFGGMMLAWMQIGYVFIKQSTWKDKGEALFLLVGSLIIQFIILFSLYCIGALGAGDCKLLLMIGMFFSIKKSIFILILSLAIAALYGSLRNSIQRIILHREIKPGIHFAGSVFAAHILILLLKL